MTLSTIGLLIIRAILGLTLAAHGSQKLFGWFGGYGIKGTGGWFESIGVKPGALFAFLAGAGELFSGIGIAVGFLTPVSAAVMVLVMLVAIATVHLKKGFWGTNGGFEFNLLIIAAAVAIGLAGPGAWSVDAVIFK